MFEDLRAAFREAVDNFNRELGKTRVVDGVDSHVRGMADEITQVRAGLKRLEADIESTKSKLTKERAAAATCRRREKLARKAPDPETAEIAAVHAQRHEERVVLLTKKLEVVEEELALGRAEARSMLEQLKEARSRRDSLAAAVGRTQARNTFSGSDDLFEDFDRFAASLDENAATSSAHMDFDPPPRPEPDIDARLAEMKRKMGKQG